MLLSKWLFIHLVTKLLVRTKEDFCIQGEMSSTNKSSPVTSIRPLQMCLLVAIISGWKTKKLKLKYVPVKICNKCVALCLMHHITQHYLEKIYWHKYTYKYYKTSVPLVLCCSQGPAEGAGLRRWPSSLGNVLICEDWMLRIRPLARTSYASTDVFLYLPERDRGLNGCWWLVYIHTTVLNQLIRPPPCKAYATAAWTVLVNKIIVPVFVLVDKIVCRSSTTKIIFQCYNTVSLFWKWKMFHLCPKTRLVDTFCDAFAGFAKVFSILGFHTRLVI